MLDTDLPELGRVHIASPCKEKWEDMKGDAQARHCAACKFTVYNFAELSSEDARQLLRRNAGGERICARIYKRLDGTVMTKDCPKGYRYGLSVARRWVPNVGPLTLALVVLIALVVGGVTVFGDNIRRLFMISGDMGMAGALSGAPETPPGGPIARKVKQRNFATDNTF